MMNKIMAITSEAVRISGKTRFLQRIRLTLALLSIGAGISFADSQPAKSETAAFFQKYLDDQTFAGGVVMVISNQTVVDFESLGYADLETKKPMQTNSFFWIASMTKPMTAVVFMTFVDEGKVSLDDPVEKYLPEFKGQQLAVEGSKELKMPDHPITVREILNHTSGLVPRAPWEKQIDTVPLKEAVARYAKSALRFEPGSKVQYCNAGINTAGRIIEVLSGKPYEQVMQERLFGPLGMNETTFYPDEAQLARLATTYSNKDKAGLIAAPIIPMTQPLLNGPARYPCPAGGLFSTAYDISLFARMMLAGGTYNGKRIVSETAVRQMSSTTASLGTGNEQGYGLGWWTSSRSRADTKTVSPALFGHAGAYATQMWIDPQRQLIAIVMTQCASFGAYAEFRSALMDAAARDVGWTNVAEPSRVSAKKAGAMDVNSDEQVSKEEFLNAWMKVYEKRGIKYNEASVVKLFESKDTNGDGVLTGEEAVPKSAGK